jgi:nicotinate phosphoribosyltransferase
MSPNHPDLTHGALFTDLYQLTMAQLYFRYGIHQRPAQFDHFFRAYPDYGRHQAGYCINAGLATFVEWMGEARFGDAEIEALREVRSVTGSQLFAEDFLGWLRGAGFESLSLQAVPEGRVVHAETPITVVTGPLAFAQIVETPLLNHLNFQTLIATKASRVTEAARGGTVIDFGMRRAADRGANAATRAALIGGARFSSNIGVSHQLGYQPKGTHAHSMVQIFMALDQGELASFQAYADVYPDDCLLLVDTINTLESGVPNAIKVFEELRNKGHRPLGIRLDSGDLAYLAIRSARMLDDAGFEDTNIVLSSSLDELAIWQILAQIEQESSRYGVDAGALIGRLSYGVGARMTTSEGAPALDGVYKVVAVEDAGSWRPAYKISDTPAKTVNPGAKNLRRIYDSRGRATADLIGRVGEDTEQPLELRHPTLPDVSRTLGAEQIAEIEALLVPIVDEGVVVSDLGDIERARQRREADLERLDPGVRRLVNPHVYHVSLTPALWQLRHELVAGAR